MQKIDVNKILTLLKLRAGVKPTLNLRHPEFTAQNNAIDDPSRFKAYNCTRRAGKSTSIAIDFLECADKYQETNYLYLGLTIGSARAILWEDLKRMAELNYVSAKAHEAYTELRLSNKSTIFFAGADCSDKQMRRILGRKFKKIAIDEAGSYTIDMERLVYQMCRPTLIDQQGTLILLGTCENIPLTFFESVTSGKEKGWSIHRWTAADNPFIAANWAAEIELILKENPAAVNASWFKTHFLNQWCTDQELQIIDLSQAEFLDELPVRKKDYNYVLGIDLGWNDATAFAVWAYHEFDKRAFVVESEKERELDFKDIYDKINMLNKKYAINAIVIDGANKQGVEHMRRRYGLPLEAAHKQDKAIFLRMLRDDILTKRVAIIKGKNNQLITEWKQLQWADKYKELEDSRCQNHISDASLYAFRECFHYYSKKEIPKLSRDSQDYMDKLEQDEAELMQYELNKKKGGYGLFK